MYFADLFNSNHLLQHLGGYVKKRGQGNSNTDEFLFHATIVLMGTLKVRALNAFCLSQMQTARKHLTVKDERIIFLSPTMVELLTLIPPSLASLVVMQNKIFPLLLPALGFKQSPPSSFHEAMKHLDTYNLPRPVKQKTLSYWQKTGQTARQYRDIAEHHYYLLARTYYQFTPDEKVLIYLPDDPNQKSHKKYSFDKKIDCIAYLEQSFLALCQYVDAVLSDVGFAKEPIPQTINETEIVLEEGVRKTLGVMFSDTAGQVGLEFGQDEERHLFFRPFDYREHPTGTS
jgi:hypothetical protein